MPRTVLIVPHTNYATPVDDTPLYLAYWAAAFDRSDGVARMPAGPPPWPGVEPSLEPEPGQLIDTYVTRAIWPPRGRWASPTELAELVRAETRAAFRQAAEWAEHGTIAVAADHGPELQSAEHFVSLAPLGALRVTALNFQRIVLFREGRLAGTELTPEERTVHEIGEMLRAHHVARVDVLSCNIGVGARGQTLLDWMHQAWGVVVRGLQGVFSIVDDGDAWVTPPTQFCRMDPEY